MPDITELLPPDILARWLEALRSGTYKQGRQRLRNAQNCYCCLGVLCDLIDPKAWIKDSSTYFYGDAGNSSMPPNSVATLLPERMMSKLIDLNDGQDASFIIIAHYIEHHWPKAVS